MKTLVIGLLTVLVCMNYFNIANAMVYERVIKVTDTEVRRVWTEKRPMCREVVKDCEDVLKEDSRACKVKARQLEVREKCSVTATEMMERSRKESV